MLKGKAIIHSKMGIHARPAAVIASYIKKSGSDVTFQSNGTEVDGGNYIKLMSCRFKYQEEISIIVDGPDEDEVLNHLITLLETLE